MSDDEDKLSPDQLRVGKYVFQVDRVDHPAGERWKSARLQNIREMTPGDEIVAQSGSFWQHRLVVEVNEATKQYTALEFVPDYRNTKKKVDEERGNSSDSETFSTDPDLHVLDKSEIRKKLDDLTKAKHAPRRTMVDDSQPPENPYSILQKCGVLHFHCSMNVPDAHHSKKRAVDDDTVTVHEPVLGVIQRKVKKFTNRIYKLNYMDEICLETEQTLINAYRLLDSATEKSVELHYDMFKNNNEHFTSWCKTGYGFSTQTGYEHSFYDEDALDELNGRARLPRVRELTFAEKVQESLKSLHEALFGRFTKVTKQFEEIKYDIMDTVDQFRAPERRTRVINNFDSTRESSAPEPALTVKIGDIVVLLEDPNEDGWALIHHDEKPDEKGYVPFSSLEISSMVS